MRGKLFLSAILILAMASEAAPTAIGGGPTSITIPLRKMTAAKQVALRCVEGSQALSLPIPLRWDIERFEIGIAYRNSINLIAGSSQLAVRWNGLPVSQFRLDPESPEAEGIIIIPPELLKPGYNELVFTALHHYRDKCESYCSPDLWTEIDLDKSFIKIDYTHKPVPLRLSALPDFIFDPRIFPEAQINVIIPDRTPETMTMAAIAVSGIARRFDYRKVHFNVSSGVKEGMDNILVGGADFASRVLPSVAGKIEGPFLKVAPLPFSDGTGDTAHGLLVISGKTPDQVLIAAETLANLTFPFPGTDEMTVIGFKLPDIPLYGGRLVITSDKTYDFGTLNFPTSTFRGMNPESRNIVFRLPADFLMKHNRTATMRLNFSYGPGLRPGSSLTIGVNGKFVKAIELDNPKGAFIEGYELGLPAYLFKPGTNELEFAPALLTDFEECQMIQTGNLFLTIFDVSTLYFPEMPHFVKLPNLELMMVNGFPFTRWPDGFESLIFLASTEDETVSAAFDTAGFLTQRNGYPLLGIKLTDKFPSSWDGEIIAVGTVDKMPKAVIESAPMRLAGEVMANYPVVTGWESEALYASIRQRGGLGSGVGVVMQYESPLMKGRTIVLVTASEPSDLKELGAAILDSGVQAAIKGDIALIELSRPDYKVHTQMVGDEFYTGKLGEMSRFRIFLYSHPSAYFIAVGLAAALGSWMIFYVLKRRKMRSAGDEKH